MEVKRSDEVIISILESGRSSCLDLGIRIFSTSRV